MFFWRLNANKHTLFSLSGLFFPKYYLYCLGQGSDPTGSDSSNFSSDIEKSKSLARPSHLLPPSGYIPPGIDLKIWIRIRWIRTFLDPIQVVFIMSENNTQQKIHIFRVSLSYWNLDKRYIYRNNKLRIRIWIWIQDSDKKSWSASIAHSPLNHKFDE